MACGARWPPKSSPTFPHGLRQPSVERAATRLPQPGPMRLPTAVRKVAVLSCKLTTRPRRSGPLPCSKAASRSTMRRNCVGMEVQIPLADRLPLPGGSYYVTDLIGCAVRDESGAEIGKIRDVDHIGESVRGALPSRRRRRARRRAADSSGAGYLRERRPRRRGALSLSLPEGLSDLNRSSS